MNQHIIDAAQNLINIDYSVIPVKANKSPDLFEWGQYQQQAMDVTEVPAKFNTAEGVGLICGAVSDGLEILDFDAHGKKIEQVFETFMADEKVSFIFSKCKPYIERTKRGGYHIAYKYDCDSGKREGTRVPARWETGETMIEVRGEGSYTVIHPTTGYEAESGDLEFLPRLSEDQRSYIVEYLETFNLHQTKPSEQVAQTEGDKTDPVSWFNWNKADYAKNLLIEAGWKKLRYDEKQDIEYWERPGKDEGSTSATWGKKHNALYIFSMSAAPFKHECYYTPFQILVRTRFKGSHRTAYEWVISKYFDDEIPYIRIGTDYFKKIDKVDRFGIVRKELKRWAKDEIKQDHGKTYLESVPHFDDFTIEPNNLHYSPVVKNCYNLYREFPHTPHRGTWKWTEVLIRHIFGEQYDLGIRYLQALYLNPDHIMPILVLVSRERQTGKTTFINWLGMVFGDNMANISPEDLINGFNSTYAASNIVAIEETLFEKNLTIDKLKDLATKKFITVNQKFVSQYRMPYFGKIILTSNNENKFARIDQEEIRFFIRKVPPPTTDNHNIEGDMVAEIPAFLHYLTTLPPVNWSKDRTGFTPAELDNNALRLVKSESMSETCKEISMLIGDMFENELTEVPFFYADARAIKERFYSKDNRNGYDWIRKVLKEDLHLEQEKESVYFRPFKVESSARSGRPFKFPREMFTDSPINVKPIEKFDVDNGATVIVKDDGSPF